MCLSIWDQVPLFISNSDCMCRDILVLYQFLLALFGYLPAYFSGQILYSIVRNSTKLPIVMDANKTILIFILILVMCMGSAGIAMRKLVDADPAEIF